VAAYTVAILPSALRQLAELPRHDQRRIKERIDRLAADPRPPGVKKLQGESDLFRLRSGNYRVIYSVEDVRLTVLVIRIGHRRDVYRGL
jgi:mRNA interferase RelE/StbE